MWHWMALSHGNFLQCDGGFAASWPWGRACVSPLAEDKYAAALRRCSVGGWFPLRHFSQVISLSLHCSLFSAGIRMRSECFQTRLRWMSRPLLTLTVSKHCANAIMICGGRGFSVANKFQVQKSVRYTNVKLSHLSSGGMSYFLSFLLPINYYGLSVCAPPSSQVTISGLPHDQWSPVITRRTVSASTRSIEEHRPEFSRSSDSWRI